MVARVRVVWFFSEELCEAMSARDLPAQGAPNPYGGGSIPPSGIVRPGDSTSPAPSVVPQHVAGPGSTDQHDLSSLMLRGRMPSQLRWVSDGLVRSLTQTIVDLSNVLQSFPTDVTTGTLHARSGLVRAYRVVVSSSGPNMGQLLRGTVRSCSYIRGT